MRDGPLKLNVSPDTVPSIGPAWLVTFDSIICMDPLTLDPCCSSLSSIKAPSVDRQVPVTSTVTSVCWIQSGFAQPEAHAITATRIIRATVFISQSALLQAPDVIGLAASSALLHPCQE